MIRSLVIAVLLLLGCGDGADRRGAGDAASADAGGEREGVAMDATDAAAAETGDPCARGCSMILEVGEDRLHGSLLLPDGAGPHPAVLIHAGSGPTDRDGNTPLLSGRNDSLLQLAEGLRDRGVASLRYDKRGVGESAPALTTEVGFVIDVLVSDLAAWHGRLLEDDRIARVTLVGHSEGSLIAILAAQMHATDGLVSLAGPGRPAGDVLREQLSAQLSGELLAQAESFIATLEAGEEIEGEIPAALQALFRPSVHDYLRSWLAHDPPEALAKLETRHLAVIQGTTDVQVAVNDAELLAAGHPHAALHVIEGMNHVLKETSSSAADQMAAYTDPSLPIPTELFDIIAPIARGE